MAGTQRQRILTDVGQVNFGTPVSLYQTETAVTIVSAGNFTVPSGYIYITGDGTAAQLQYSPNSGSTYRQFNSTGYGGTVDSDGYNWRVHNSATTSITIWWFSIN